MDTKDNKIDLTQLPQVAGDLVDNVPYDFCNYVNDRRFEMQITSLSGKIEMTDVKYCQVKKQIEQQLQNNQTKVAFVLYFAYFTKYRRQKRQEAVDIVEEFGECFDCFEINKHVRLLADYSACNSGKRLGRLMREASALCVDQNKKLYNHVGVINLFCELTCAYYEKNLDERSDDEGQKQLRNALKSILRAIEIEEENHKKEIEKEKQFAKENGVEYIATEKNTYHKLYLNKGRLLVLMGRFDDGESEMNRAIQLLPNDKDRENRIRLYEGYITKASIIRTYALSDDKYKDLEKIKVSTYKTVTLTTTLLGFLLGSIKIYETVTDVFTLAMLMLGYMSLLLVLCGTVLFGLSLALKEKKRGMMVYNGVLIVAGVALFVLAIVLILNYGYAS